MDHFPSKRGRVWTCCVVVVGAMAIGCNERGPTGVGFPDLDVQLVQPLEFAWPGRDDGVPFVSQRGTFSATANARVEWSLRMEAIPTDPSDPRFAWANGLGPPLLKQTATFQERLYFSWRRDEVFGGRWPFAVGDTCVAVLRYGPSLDNDTVRETVIRFVIGGGVLPEDDDPTPP